MRTHGAFEWPIQGLRDTSEMPATPEEATGRDVGAELDLAQLLSSMAHDLRGPLTALTNSAALVVEDFDAMERGELREMLEAIHRRALWLQGLLDNVLSAEDLRHGLPSIQRRPMLMTKVIDEVVSVIRPLLERRSQHVLVRGPAGLADIPADSQRVGQVLVNLVLNASKFAPEGTRIDVIVALHPGAVRVVVSDRGPGIPAGSGALLFDAFYRAPTTEHQDGVGLGLAIVKAIVQAHGGNVGAAPRRGGGSRFWFELPTTG